MSKRSRKNNIERLIEQGRGCGILSNYKPWILVQDVPSLGRSTRLRGIKTGRQHEFLSDMEKNYFYFLEYSDEVIDIREQYPLLPLEETVVIAKELGIEHPKQPKTGELIVMTTDFLITQNNLGNKFDVARTIKSKEDLFNKRVLEKFEIERVYWKRRDVDWGIVTNKEINKIVAKNINYFHSYYGISDLDIFRDMDNKEIQDMVSEYLKRLVDTDKSIRYIGKIFEEDMNLLKGSGIAIFKHLLARKTVRIDMTKEIDINKSMNIEVVQDITNKEFNIS